MEILNHEYPPNYDLIKAALNPEAHAIFCYGKKIYNPSARELDPSIEHHESIHCKQQGTDIDGWYFKYLTDPAFRLSQELEAYGEQYKYTKRSLEALNDAMEGGKKLVIGKTDLLSYALDSMAYALSGVSYGGLISFAEARSKIRNYAKNSA